VGKIAEMTTNQGFRTCIAFAVALAAGAAAPRVRAEELVDLVRRADHALRGQTTAAILKMHVHTKGFDRSYDIVYWGDERGKSRALIKVLGPARWRGHGTLKVGSSLSLYDPSSDRVTVLSGSMLGDNWMGSHFTNDDLVKETDLGRDYTVRELKHWTAPIAGKDATFYRVRLDPTPRAPVAWDHQVFELYAQGSAVVPVSEEFYKKKDQPAPTRTLSFDAVKDMGGRIVPTRLVMRVAEPPGEYTELVYDKLKFDADVPAGKFNEQALRR
jgi:hypothetical protein